MIAMPENDLFVEQEVFSEDRKIYSENYNELTRERQCCAEFRMAFKSAEKKKFWIQQPYCFRE